MKQFSIQQQQNVVLSSFGEDMRDSLIWPKPRRIALFNDDWSFSSGFGSDALDTILTKGDCEYEQFWSEIASPPAFFCGSPPSRVTNPLIQDARFGDDNFSLLSSSSRAVFPATSGLSLSPSSSSVRKGGCVRSNFGNNPVVRVEGFDCLDRHRRNCSIPALA